MCEKREKSKLGFWGVILTIVYFVAIGSFVFCTSSFEDFENLKLNGLGDFLAGVFGPPALIWVVISFYLQSDELRHSVDALNSQAKELSDSVDQQEKIVAGNREQLRVEQEARTLDLGLKIENMKVDIDIMLEEIQPLTISVNDSRRAWLAAIGLLDSGRMEVWKKSHQLYLSKYEYLKAERSRLSLLEYDPDNLGHLTNGYISYYRVKGETIYLLSRLKKEIASDEFERSERRADSSATLN